MIPEFGDEVKVHTKEQVYEGIMLPRPEILDENYTIIKLENGYNIGIENKKIQKIEVLKKYERKKEPKIGLKQAKKNLPTVSILSFGGTISSKLDYRTGGVYADYTAEDFVRMLPELEDIANLRAEKVMSIMSEDLSPQDWQSMARRIAKELNENDVDGVVITHGTDTMHFSAAAMSFFLKHLNKPVVFTGAQRSIDRGSSDAFFNLLCSVNAAAKFDGAAVVTCLHGTGDDNYCILNRGSRVRKMHTSRRDAFRPIGELPLAKVYEDGRIEILNNNYQKRNRQKVSVYDEFESKTALVHVYPGIDPEVFDFYMDRKYRGIVIAATGLGHVPTFNPKNSLIKKLKELIDNGVAVCIAPQTIYGRVHPYVYSPLRKLSIELKCIFLEDMLPEAAYIKLGWVLGHASNPQEIKKMMLTNYTGELTERTNDKGFLC